MQRRRYLILVGTAGSALAGCSDPKSAEGTIRQRNRDTPTETRRSRSTDAITDEPTETPTAAGEPDIVLGDGALTKDEGGYRTDTHVDAIVTNEGDAASGRVKLTVEWYDENDDYLDSDVEYLQTLRPGETWAARVEAIQHDEEIEGFELHGEFNVGPPESPEKVELLESELETSPDGEVSITGRVANETGDDLDYLEAIGQLIDDQGRILADRTERESGIPEGETWRFSVDWIIFDRVDAVADHRTVLDGSFF